MAKSRIDSKYDDLKSKNLDLGAPKGPEKNAGYGGTYREYQTGNIYYHPVMGDAAHVVHGGVLGVYLANGGHDVDSRTGVRKFGFPLSDELSTKDELTPYSEFETGAVYWTPGTGGVAMWGDIHTAYRKYASLGLPISDQVPTADGEAVYFERGLLWTSAKIKGTALMSTIGPALIGQPTILGPGSLDNLNLMGWIQWQSTPNDLAKWLPVLTQSILTQVWTDRLFLSPVGGGVEVALQLQTSHPGTISESTNTIIVGNLQVKGTLADSKLYDLHLKAGNGKTYNLSPHCVFAKSSWDDFGLLHATDIHLSLRNQQLRDVLTKEGLADAAAHVANFQDNFRDFIKYANHLHAQGLAHLVIGTGDLIDYIVEVGDNPYSGNFERFRRMLLGQPFDSGVPAGEELSIPIFLTFGNHDYRPYGYDLSVHISVLGQDKKLDEYSSHNLTYFEALKAQGGDKPIGLSDYGRAKSMFEYDTSEQAYRYFAKYMSRDRTFAVKLGSNRVVILDTLYDDGVPALNNVYDLVKFLVEYELGDYSTATSRLLNNCGDIKGLTQSSYEFSARPIREVGDTGVVILGMHVPPFSPLGDYPYYFRETVHPVCDPKRTTDYLQRNKVKSDGWSLSGTPYFKTGDAGNGQGLDNGVIGNFQMDFIRLCTGVGLNAGRPIDLLLCGHHHDRTEYRLQWNGQAPAYFMDFYLEEPSTYYSTTNGYDCQADGLTIPANSRLAVKIDASAPQGCKLNAVTVHGNGASEVRGVVTTPPYATPLDTATDPKQWWKDHRPIIAQTAALGPVDPRQRFDPMWRKSGTSDVTEAHTQPADTTRIVDQWPDPTFNGFRLVQVKGNVINKVRYITLADLRKANFNLPWETHSIFGEVLSVRGVTQEVKDSLRS